MIWALLGVLFLLIALFAVVWWHMQKEERISPLPSAQADEETSSDDPEPPSWKLNNAFPVVTSTPCANCGTPLPETPKEDRYIHCAYCESVLVTPDNPFPTPIPLQAQHTVGITTQDGNVAIRMDGQTYSHIDDIPNPESRRVANWALQRHFARMNRGPRLTPSLFSQEQMAEEVEKILRQKLWRDPLLRHKQVALDIAPDGLLRIEVDGQRYDSVDQIPGARLQQLFRDSIREWERSH